MSNGQGCTCNAWAANECACGADWTPQEVYDLRAENASLKAELAEVKKDAERYAAVKGRAYVGISRNNECLWVLRGVFEVKYDAAKTHGFDAAIDEIMKGK